jgi:hypothetical protein
MTIFYAVQATGNGHISRAMEMLPYLQQYGQVDIFLSGANSTLCLDVPIKYRSNGCSLFYNRKGALDYKKIICNFSPLRIYNEIRELPVERRWPVHIKKYPQYNSGIRLPLCRQTCRCLKKKMF